MKKIIFKIDEGLDLSNHIIGAKVSENIENISPSISEYYKKIRSTQGDEREVIFKKRTAKFYSESMTNIRVLLIKQTQEMWDMVENEYISRMEKIHKNKFPFETVSGILTTAPFGYGYNFNEETPWFACSKDSPLLALHTTMHELMHSFFKYFYNSYKEKYNLSDKQMWDIKESLTVLLNIEFDDLRMNPDKGHPGHEKLRENIKENWLKYRDIDTVLDKACSFIK